MILAGWAGIFACKILSGWAFIAVAVGHLQKLITLSTKNCFKGLQLIKFEIVWFGSNFLKYICTYTLWRWTSIWARKKIKKSWWNMLEKFKGAVIEVGEEGEATDSSNGLITDGLMFLSTTGVT